MLKMTAKITVSILVIAILLSNMDVGQALSMIGGADPYSVVISVAIILLLSLPQSYRWMIAVRAIDGVLPLSRAFRILLIGWFFNQVLPSSIGGDALRVWYGCKSGLTRGQAFYSVVIDRLSALYALVIIVLFGLPWVYASVRDHEFIYGLYIIVGASLASLALLFIPYNQWDALLPEPLAVRIKNLSDIAKRLISNLRAVVLIFSISCVAHFGISVVVALLAAGMNISLGLIECVVLVPVVLLITAIPVSVAGWGVREGAMVFVLGQIGVPAEQAFALSVIFGLVVMLSGLPGGAFWLMIRHEPSVAKGVSSRL